MRKVKLVNKFTLLCIVIILSACSKKAPKVEYEIPTELKDNEKAVELIEDVAESVQNINNGFAKMIVVSFDVKEKYEEKEDGENNEEKTGSVWQIAKAGISALKMAHEQEKMKEMIKQADSLKKELTVKQCIALDTTLARLERQVGKVDIDKLGISEEQLAEFKANDGKMSFSTNPEKEENEKRIEEYNQLSEKEGIRKIEQRENEGEIEEEGYSVQEENIDEETNKKMDGWDYVWVILMLIVVIGIFILPIILLIRFVIHFLRD